MYIYINPALQPNSKRTICDWQRLQNTVATVFPGILAFFHKTSYGKQIHMYILEGSLEVELPTVWTNRKAQPGNTSGMDKSRREKIGDGEDQERRWPEERRCRCAKKKDSRETLCLSNVLWLLKVEKWAR